MSAAEIALEDAILAKLVDDAEVSTLLDDPLRMIEAGGPRPAFPYLELVRHRCEATGGVDAEASEHYLDLHVLSRDAGGRQAQTALAAIRAALEDGPAVMAEWRCVLLLPVFADTTRQAPGLWRAMLRVKAVVEAA